MGDPADVSFRHGVASGDPLQDGIVIWTRITTDAVGDVPVEWWLEDLADPSRRRRPRNDPA